MIPSLRLALPQGLPQDQALFAWWQRPTSLHFRDTCALLVGRPGPAWLPSSFLRALLVYRLGDPGPPLYPKLGLSFPICNRG